MLGVDPGQLGRRGQVIARPLSGVLQAAGEEAGARPVSRHVAEGTVPGSVGARPVARAVLGPAAAGGHAHLPSGHRVIARARKVDVLRLAEEGLLPGRGRRRLVLDGGSERRRSYFSCS
jgi:hypothetical protein